MELAPYFPLGYKHQQVVKASSGHFPQPFLIRDVVRTAAKIRSSLSYFQIPIFIFDICLIINYLKKGNFLPIDPVIPLTDQ
jgi:hypothetical protein